MASAEVEYSEPLTYSSNNFTPYRVESDSQPGSDREIDVTATSLEQMEDPYIIQYKHPLEHIWTLWALENDRTKHWRDMLNEITQIDTIEKFWGVYYTLKPPSELRVGCDYYMFKTGIQPMWEDEANINGGRWLFTIGRNCKDVLDRIWLDIVLMMVGESFEYASEICGAVVNIRGRSNKISVWTANGSNETAVMEIGFKLKSFLHLPSHLQYQLHSDAMAKISSAIRSVYNL